MTKKIVYFCILGVAECTCGEVDQFCVNTRRREVEEEDGDEETNEEKAPLLPDVQAAQDWWREPLECQRT